MILTSDIQLYNPIWEEAENKINNQLGVFARLIDLYLVACAIGIKEDKVIEDSGDVVIKTIGRNTTSLTQNPDVNALIVFMLRNALINSKTINYSIDDRLKMAFVDDDGVNKKISPASFLNGFANYGITKIMESIKSDSDIVAISELYDYLNNMAEEDYDAILSDIKL